MITPSNKAVQSYSGWIRDIIRQSGIDGRGFTSLFGSSVPEPQTELHRVVKEAFCGEWTSRYVSTFASGNPYLIGLLALRHQVDADQIICTTGATGALALLYRALVKPGERILIETPGFDLFTHLATAHNISVDYIRRHGEQAKLDLSDIEARATSTTRLIVLTNLHNPSGNYLDNSTLAQLADLAERLDLIVVFDEVYGDYAPHQVRPAPANTLSPRFVSVNSLTKIYGLSTLRCGWLAAAPDIVARVRPVWEGMEFGLSNFSHAVAALVLENPAPFDAYWRKIVAEARPVLTDCFGALEGEDLVRGGLPEFGCIAFPELIGMSDSAEFCDWLYQRSRLVVAPGKYFGAPKHIRIGFGMPVEKLEPALAELSRALTGWRENNLVRSRSY